MTRMTLALGLSTLLATVGCFDSGGGANNEEPCVRAAQVTSSGLTASCKTGFVFQGRSMGILQMTHDFSLSRGCDAFQGTLSNTMMPMMGNVGITLDETTNKVTLTYNSGLDGGLQIQPASGMKDKIIAYKSTPGDPRMIPEIVDCPGLDAVVSKLATDRGEIGNGTSCSGPNAMMDLMSSFGCPALDRIAMTSSILNNIDTDMMQQAKLTASHILARSMTRTMLKNGGPQKQEVIAVLTVIIKLLSGMTQGDKVETPWMPQVASQSPDDASGAYMGRYNR